MTITKIINGQKFDFSLAPGRYVAKTVYCNKLYVAKFTCRINTRNQFHKEETLNKYLSAVETSKFEIMDDYLILILEENSLNHEAIIKFKSRDILDNLTKFTEEYKYLTANINTASINKITTKIEQGDLNNEDLNNEDLNNEELKNDDNINVAGPFNYHQIICHEDCKGRVYPCLIMDMLDDKIFIHYLGWSSKWDCWVDSEKIKKIKFDTSAIK